jgi:hypothetical protein
MHSRDGDWVSVRAREVLIVTTDGVVAFNVPNKIKIKPTPNLALAGEGQEVTFNLKAICECVGKNTVTVKDVLSNDVIYIPGSGGTLAGNTVSFHCRYTGTDGFG